MGGASKFGPTVRASVLDEIKAGKSLRAIAEQEGMPSPALVILWVKEDPAYAEQYARAKEVQAHLMAEEILDIADDGSNDTYINKKGDEVVNEDVISRSRLRVDSRKWLLSKMLPKVYGEKVELTGKDGTPLIPPPIYMAPDAPAK